MHPWPAEPLDCSDAPRSRENIGGFGRSAEGAPVRSGAVFESRRRDGLLLKMPLEAVLLRLLDLLKDLRKLAHGFLDRLREQLDAVHVLLGSLASVEHMLLTMHVHMHAVAAKQMDVAQMFHKPWPVRLLSIKLLDKPLPTPACEGEC